MRWRRAVVLLLTILSALTVSTPVQARPEDLREDKKRVDAELAKTGSLLEAVSATARNAAARLAEVNRALPLAQERLGEARGAVAAAETQAESAQAESAQASKVFTDAQGRYEFAATQVVEGRVRLSRFATAAYKGGEVSQFNALMGAGGPSQLLERTGYVQHIAESKKDAVDQLVSARHSAKEVANEAEVARNTADRAAKEARTMLATAVAARIEAETAERNLKALAEENRVAVQAAEASRADVLEQYEEAKRESERIAAELRAWEAEQDAQQAGSQGPQAKPPVLKPGARLLMPVRGWKSSDYGSRYDPYYHVWQLHAGVDIAAGGGEPIYAAADGRVATAGWSGGYGNYTCIYHGKYRGESLNTCYAHQSRILVRRGQSVRRGQLIGRVGTTGASTGNHLHFEVRLDGDPTDPENWLPGCLC